MNSRLFLLAGLGLLSAVLLYHQTPNLSLKALTAAVLLPRHESSLTSDLLSNRTIVLNDEKGLENAYQYLRKCLSNPVARDELRELVFTPYYPTWGDYGDPPLVDEHEMVHDEPVLQAFKDLNFTQGTQDHLGKGLRWRAALQKPDAEYGLCSGHGNGRTVYAETVMILLLALCPNIEVFKFNHLSFALEEFLLQNNFDERPLKHLPKLRHLEVDVVNSPSYDDRFFTSHEIIGTLRSFHRLPSIDSFYVRGIGMEERDLWPPGTSNFKKIRLEQSDLPSTILATIIRMSKQLEEFTASLGGFLTNDGSSGGMMYPLAIGKALDIQKDSLRVLNLDIDKDIHHDRSETDDFHESDYDPEDLIDHIEWQRDKYWRKDEELSSGELLTKDMRATQDYGQTVGSFRNFSKLTHLSIGVKALLGEDEEAPFHLVDALPPTLEFLLIRGYRVGENSKHTKQIRELMDRQSEKLPNLRRIEGVDKYIPSGKLSH